MIFDQFESILTNLKIFYFTLTKQSLFEFTVQIKRNNFKNMDPLHIFQIIRAQLLQII